MNHFTSSISAVVMLIVVWGVVIANTMYCFYKLFKSDRRLGEDDK